MAFVTIDVDTDGFLATADDTYYVIHGGRLTNAGIAFSFNDQISANLLVEGDIHGEGNAVFVPLLSTDADLQILDGGRVTSLDDDAVSIAGGIEIYNDGFIISGGGDAITATSSSVSILNDGRIVGVDAGIRLSAGGTIVNNGAITGTATAVELSGGGVFNNNGSVNGDVVIDAAVLHDNGIIDGDVSGGAAADVVRVKGIVTGQINLFGGADSYVGGGLDAAVVDGGDGADTLTGGLSDDSLSGGNDDDALRGRGGADALNGGDGNDLLVGGAGDDELAGFTGTDSLFGGFRDDNLNGGEGNDVLRGQQGDDDLNGDAGNDLLFGAAGSDVLDGRAGNDLLNGGSGGDTFLFSPGGGSDVVRDFAHTVDGLDLTAFAFASLAAALALASESNGDVVFNIAPGVKLTVDNITKAELAEDLFV